MVLFFGRLVCGFVVRGRVVVHGRVAGRGRVAVHGRIAGRGRVTVRRRVAVGGRIVATTGNVSSAC